MSGLWDERRDTSISFVEGSRAKTCLAQVPTPKDLALMVLAVAFGRSTPASLARFDPATSSWKTSQTYLGTDWTESSLTLPVMGTMRSGFLCPLPTWGPRISDIDCLLLPTLTKWDGTHGGRMTTLRPFKNAKGGIRHRCKNGGSASIMLSTRAKHLGGRLNPRWCEWFMGFPVTWCVTRSSPLAPSATRSSRKSRKSSGGSSEGSTKG